MADLTILLHGFMGTGADLQPLMDHLPGPTRALDLPGHGDAADLLPDNQPANLAWMAGHVEERIRLLSKRPVHLVGYSMGGRIALYLALQSPKLLRSLTLIAASPGISDGDERRKRRTDDAHRAQHITADFPVFLQRWYQLPIFGDLRHHPQFDALIERRLDQSPAAMARIIQDMSPGAQPDLWPRLSELKVPHQWIAGKNDPKYASLIPRAAQLSGGPYHLIDDAAHSVHIEHPKACGEPVSGLASEKGISTDSP